MQNKGKISQVIGPVVDIRFNEGELPNLNNAVNIMMPDRVLVVEVAQHVGDDVVRCISMGAPMVVYVVWKPLIPVQRSVHLLGVKS